ncbi:hypothetical protein GLOIN_2v1486009 [Rhizophagus irregularis DAOM 181602=DAOM 197198]|uniref:Uncharacterized protein n=1 Tax=Rhizophagus irregularis (strain DAOM 181602 / DAOM 197198 / MUCL 43194) TaxID=747089 RepID=A0A2P4P8L5_RHIID|nr:hypothetical protein GLOIN_2v1486009 [Rhizophagus irregularis DAOM 181602=DAOM 197198]POG61707.1 hypothetical protein GLOIN_2v1486009 [Rhizophagus irregularis DAOM 181602=DAOM 197198]|eukprot:XP_025168573.1 hypothetical protein GLOIN_2v1486009 [Rhizophagus irregularis DAOM 181602=DAOM 197198]
MASLFNQSSTHGHHEILGVFLVKLILICSTMHLKEATRRIIGQLGEGKSHAKDALYNLRYNLKLNNEEKECIEKLKGLLKNVDMMLDDFKLLHEVKSKSNMMFHRNNQDLKAAKLQLNDTVLDGVKIYKPPIKKALEAIGKWGLF